MDVCSKQQRQTRACSQPGAIMLPEDQAVRVPLAARIISDSNHRCEWASWVRASSILAIGWFSAFSERQCLSGRSNIEKPRALFYPPPHSLEWLQCVYDEDMCQALR